MIERSKDVIRGRPGGLTGLARDVAWLPAPRGAGFPGGFMPSDDELLERTLAFSGSYVSDDGSVAIRRTATGAVEYSGARFIGYCAVCSRALLVPATGEPLADVSAAVRFRSTHDHGDVD